MTRKAASGRLLRRLHSCVHRHAAAAASGRAAFRLLVKQPLHMFATAPLLRSVCACVRVRAGGSEGVCAPALEHEHEVAGGGRPSWRAQAHLVEEGW